MNQDRFFQINLSGISYFAFIILFPCSYFIDCCIKYRYVLCWESRVYVDA